MLHAPHSYPDVRCLILHPAQVMQQRYLCMHIQAADSDAVQDRKTMSLHRSIRLDSRDRVGGRVHTPQSCAGCIVACVHL